MQYLATFTHIFMQCKYMPEFFDYPGIRLDHGLTMSPLLQRLYSRMTSRFLLMITISGLIWGTPAKVLSLFYKQAVRTLFDYAANSISWVSLCRTNTRARPLHSKAHGKDMLMLENIQFQAVCLVTRACMTTRVVIRAPSWETDSDLTRHKSSCSAMLRGGGEIDY